MVDYEVMSIEELNNYIFNFWKNFGAFNYTNKTEQELKNEICNNLKTLNGVEKELDYIRQEFESGWDENSLEYQNLDILWNYVNWYKTDLQSREV